MNEVAGGGGTGALSLVGVIGAGTMGGGIAHVVAQSGFNVRLFDIEERLLDQSLSGISRNMARQVSRGALSVGDRTAALDRIMPTRTLDDLAGADFVIEAVTEKLDVKGRVFSELDRIVKPDAVLASNTSSISIDSIAATTRRPHLVIGMHFMNPVPMMELVEVVLGKRTAEATAARTLALAEAMGKTAVTVNDSPGFVSNRILIPMINEAAFCLMEGVGTAEAIDSVMRLGMKHPLGPLALADLIGLDVCLHIMEVLENRLGDPKYRPCPLLVERVRAGHLGRKSGRGFHTYGSLTPAPPK